MFSPVVGQCLWCDSIACGAETPHPPAFSKPWMFMTRVPRHGPYREALAFTFSTEKSIPWKAVVRVVISLLLLICVSVECRGDYTSVYKETEVRMKLVILEEI